ncbi:multiheme c-type cytochrome [Saccharospirillum salsuginis]|uniref:Cytochrome c domain-containing protein n=1 Tax=Saccharospirillum salsuginis TaxID=418750 RepID=A0A918NGN8_9GAMM|nr:multiheme c-type cytochrome [Saccharospirillum salsuginis]GGX66141.1 hypothetical protein GCM10007392_37230 [Saccharospirillum salsuginis]
MWAPLHIPWGLQRWSLLSHTLIGAFVFPILVLPFWFSHRRLLSTSGKPFLRWTGRSMDILLLTLTLTGAWLFLKGNRGNAFDAWIGWAHLYPGLMLAPLLARHAWRWGVLRPILAMLLVATPIAAQGAVSSGSLISHPTGPWLFSANAEAGTVSRLHRSDPTQRNELRLGRDIRQLAVTADGRILAATGYLDDHVWLLDAEELDIRTRVELEHRPYGVLYDAANDRFWVSLFESHELVALSRAGEIVQRIPTADTPRGLALLSDGRLVVTHSMTGELSVYDTRRADTPLLQRFTLTDTSDPDEFVSQGVPRRLDDIAVVPDESELWLPHVLWNVDHPFQFQSTVYPAVSIVTVGPTGFTEDPTRRKELFRQINLTDVDGRTQIVSNPVDAEFSTTGAKVFITLAGSEDLLVFDRARSRSGEGEGERRARRVGKIDQGGAQAVQLLRHLPGAQPYGLVVDNDTLWVQNRQSLNLTRLTTGGDSPFARVRVTNADYARLSEADALTPMERRGSHLFHSGNTDRNPEYPMTGDFWMSCNSCHLDGFNLTNRYLMDDHAEDKSIRAISGHGGLSSLLSGESGPDLVRLIQDTQGGLGHDDRDNARRVTPEAIPDAIEDDIDALQAYIRRPNNLPFGPSWLRLAPSNGDRLEPSDWPSSASCAGCHQRIFEQWADSNHRLMAESNPYYRVMEDFAAETEGEAFRAWCVGCHNPQRTTVGLPFRGQENRMFSQGGEDLLAEYEHQSWSLDEGPGCVACHRVSRIEDSGGNGAIHLDVTERPTYPGEQSERPWVRWIAETTINAQPKVHAESYSRDFYDDSAYCRACHDEFSPGQGARIVTTFDEWALSSFNAPDNPEQHRSCLDCHMHADIDRIGEAIPGRSTEGGRLKDNVYTHQFTGANHHLVGLRNAEQEDMSLALLRTSAELDQWYKDGELVVRVRNVGAGHALPTGVADFRQL